MLEMLAPGPNRHAERLDAAIEVLVIQGVFIVPDPSGWVRDLVTRKPDAICSRVQAQSGSPCAPVQAMMAGCISHRGSQQL